MDTRGNLEAENLLKLILLLVVLWLVIGLLGEVLDLFVGLLGLVPDILGLIIVVLVILWLFDRI